MSTIAPTPYTSIYGPFIGRGTVERAALRAINEWIIPYVAEYERQNFLPARSTPVPPTPESIHGDMDFNRFDSVIFPEISVLVQPIGETERSEDGIYGSWFDLLVGAFVQVEGDQDATRALADVYGTALQSLMGEQGIAAAQPDGVTPAITRTRLWAAYGLAFPDPNVRDIIRATFGARVFVATLVSEFDGPLVPPLDPYGIPDDWPTAYRVEVDLVRGTPDTHGLAQADYGELDETVSPGVVKYGTTEVDVP